VVSTDPKDNDNNVTPNTKTITVTFSENIDKNTVNTGSLTLDPNVGTGPTVLSVSVSGKTATFTINGLLPNVDYLATISSSIEDTNGNFLDCAALSAVDSLCQWNFSTSGATTSAAIIINPTSGPVNTTLTVTGTGFIPNTDVTIKFDSLSGTDTTDSNGDFSFTFSVPPSTPGEHTVSASQPSILVSKTFTVTNSTSLKIGQQSSTDPFA
jgi:Bacterial Ig-like domain